ncbi:thioredoxin-disulfide reductase [Wolbachia endosymbiont of Pentidionis agamae]|uniref:thioredoxin-disulfide reductase n=1 Tax=Wolbachia endosymbiont of Pentidionis agamae TaxID=3110435 RepID=UPI0038CDC252
MYNTKVLIIGSGAAGYSAAIYAARANLEPIIVTGMQPGGQLTITTDVENYPGFVSIQGPELMEKMKLQAEEFGTQIVFDEIKSIEQSKDCKLFLSIGNHNYHSKAIIIASGAQARWLGLESEKKFQGYGVSACATCDGRFFKDKIVVVIGGGNTAVEEAIFLTNFARKVTLIHRRDILRAEKKMQEHLFKLCNEGKIEVIWNHIVEDILGNENPKKVNGIVIRSNLTQKTQQMNVDGIFIAIGHTPNTSIFKGIVDMDEENYIVTSSGTTLTSMPGIFAAGDVQDKTYRQAVVAAGTGCMAALDAEKFINAAS